MPATHYLGAYTTQVSGTGNPQTLSVTVNPGDTVLAVMIVVVGATLRTGGAPSWNGITLTQAGSTQQAATSPETSVELWYLENPKPAVANVSVPNSGALTVRVSAVTAISSSGASQFNAANGANGTSTNPAASVTTTADGCFVAAVLGGGHTDITLGTPALTQLWETDHGANGSSGQYTVQSTAGAQSTNWTHGTSDDWAICNAAFAPVRAASRIENYKGVGSTTGLSVTERIR